MQRELPFVTKQVKHLHKSCGKSSHYLDPPGPNEYLIIPEVPLPAFRQKWFEFVLIQSSVQHALLCAIPNFYCANPFCCLDECCEIVHFYSFPFFSKPVPCLSAPAAPTINGWHLNELPFLYQFSGICSSRGSSCYSHMMNTFFLQYPKKLEQRDPPRMRQGGFAPQLTSASGLLLWSEQVRWLSGFPAHSSETQ